MIYDFAIAWVSKQDAGFVEILDSACRARNLSLIEITPVNLDNLMQELEAGSISFRSLLDRSTDEDERFLRVVEWAREHDVFSVNPYEESFRARDKAGMHLSLFQSLLTPYTIILPAYNDEPQLGPLNLSRLGPTFTTKPASGGGGDGVIVLCTCFEDIQAARRQYPDDKYLLQARVVPARLGSRAAWFRVIYNVGKIYPFWWDTETHVYTPVSVAERYHYGLEPLEKMTTTIAEISRLQIFSTEIALARKGGFQVVDYVNDPVDLTPLSEKPTCIPDEILGYIAEDLVDWLSIKLKEKQTEEPEMGGEPI